MAAAFLHCQAPQTQSSQSLSGPPHATANPALLTDRQPPFDKLELFGMFAAGPIAAYASQVIHTRGCNFTPDAAFISTFPVPTFQAILRSIKPRAPKTLSADRDAALELLRRGLEATHHRQFSVSDENYQRALQLAPDSATLHLAYSTNFLLIPDGARAETEARRSLELWPDNAEAHGVLSMALMLEGKLAESIAEARETLRIFPGHTSAKFQLTASLVKNRQYDEAIPAARNALVVLPNVPALHKFLGISLLQTKQTAEAIDQLTWYVNAAPSDPEGHYYLGLALRSAGRTDEANSQFQQAPSLKPQ
jgi:tetratricopeptide (TPR) repeat protein